MNYSTFSTDLDEFSIGDLYRLGFGNGEEYGDNYEEDGGDGVGDGFYSYGFPLEREGDGEGFGDKYGYGDIYGDGDGAEYGYWDINDSNEEPWINSDDEQLIDALPNVLAQAARIFATPFPQRFL
jgi:hypothetical protein